MKFLIFLIIITFQMIVNGNEFKVSIFEETEDNTEIYNFRQVLIYQSRQSLPPISVDNESSRRRQFEFFDDSNLNKEFLNLNYKYLNISFNFLDSTKNSNDYFKINNDNLTLSIKSRLDRDSLCENKQIKTCNCHSQCVLKLDIIVNGYKIDKNTLKNQYLYNSEDVSEEHDDEENDVEWINEIISTHQNSFFYYIFTLNIHILDINDNKPYFLRNEYTIEVPENVPIGHRIPLQLIAYDSDYGKNSIVSYTLINNSLTSESINRTILAQLSDNKKNKQDSMFEIDYSNLKNLYLRVNSELDRENCSNYSYYIVAIDGGKPVPLFETVKFSIKILDHNDNSPYFEPSSFKIKISENTDIDTKLLTATAFDIDEGQNGQIEYFLVLNKNFQQNKFTSYQDSANHAISGQNNKMQQISENDNNFFKIDKDTGDLYLKDKLDFEKQSYFKLIISAIDKGIPSLYSSNQCVVEIFIYDENDNAPEIRVITSEQIQQQDKQVYFNGKQNGNVKIDQQKQTLYIEESAPVGTFICLITINDIDTGMNGKFELTVKITPDDGKIRLSDSYTKIDEILVANNNQILPTMKTYALLVAKNLDRETQSNYKIHIIARDFGTTKRLESELKVNLALIDVNDNKPEFRLLTYFNKNEKSSAMKIDNDELRIQYDYYINENNLLNAKIGCFECFDKDENENSYIDYYLSLNDTFIVTNQLLESHTNEASKIYNLIRVDPETKCFYALVSFDREIIDFYQFYLIAVDQAKSMNQKLNSSALIKIHINDVNDHVPYFTQSKYTFNLAEHSRPNTIIGQLRAYDLDTNENSKLEYKFAPISIASNNNMFKLNQTNGVLTYIGTQAQLDADRELHEFNLDINVNDKGIPSFGTTCQVKIKIVDINDNCPHLESIVDEKKLVERIIKRKDKDEIPTVDIESALLYIDRDMLIKAVNDYRNENGIVLVRLLLVDRDRDLNNNRVNISHQTYKKLIIKQSVESIGEETTLGKAYFNLTFDGYLKFNFVEKPTNEQSKNENDDLLSITGGSNIEKSYYMPSTGLYKISFHISDTSCVIKSKFILIFIGNEEKYKQLTKASMIKISYNYMKDSLQRTINLTTSIQNKGLLFLGNNNNNSITSNLIGHFNSIFDFNSTNQILTLVFFIILVLIIFLMSVLFIYCIFKYNRKCFRVNKKRSSEKYKEIANLINKTETNNNSVVETIVNKSGNVELHNNTYYTTKSILAAAETEMTSNNYKLLIENKPQIDFEITKSGSNNRYGTLKEKSNRFVESAYSTSSSTSSPITTSTNASTNVNKINGRSVLV
jgi:hypothetical protein